MKIKVELNQTLNFAGTIIGITVTGKLVGNISNDGKKIIYINGLSTIDEILNNRQFITLERDQSDDEVELDAISRLVFYNISEIKSITIDSLE